MVQGFILVEHAGADEEHFRRLSLQNAKQLVVGGIPGQIILHVAATTIDDLNRALAAIGGVKNVKSTTLLTLSKGA